MAIYGTTNLRTDDAWLADLGHGLAQRRIAEGLTQAALAREAGLGKRTVERLEQGKSVQMVSFLRVLRVLHALAELSPLLPRSTPVPMDLLKTKSHERKRASSGPPATSKVQEKWTWGESP